LDEAERHLRESVGIDPRFPVAHFRLGQLLEKQRRHDEAIQELEHAARLDPSYAAPHYVAGKIYKARGNLEAADKASTAFQELRKQENLKGIRRPE
jgi:tetratricopeptide (TPR) repeat protein